MDVNDELRNRWLLRPRPLDNPRVRLFALPYAGATGTVYHSWHKELDEGIELCAVMLPGRLSRIDEPSCTRVEELTLALTAVIASLDDAPCVFFGHSMGAVLAYYLAHQLGERGPRHLFLSGHGAPGSTPRRNVLQDLSDEEFVFYLKRYQGIPDIIASEPDLLRLIIPALRADFLLLDQIIGAPLPVLDIPFTVLSGNDDLNVPAAGVEAWRALTQAPCSIEFMPGGHFFIQPQRSAVIARINQVCRAL